MAWGNAMIGVSFLGNVPELSALYAKFSYHIPRKPKIRPDTGIFMGYAWECL